MNLSKATEERARGKVWDVERWQISLLPILLVGFVVRGAIGGHLFVTFVIRCGLSVCHLVSLFFERIAPLAGALLRIGTS